MANRLKMSKIHSIQTLRALGWSQRRIARALDVDRETVARYVRAAECPQDQPNPPIGAVGPRDPPAGGQDQPNLPAGSNGPANRPLEDWGKLLGDVPVAAAILDRFLHNAHVSTIAGRSYRLRQKAERANPPRGTQLKKVDKAAREENTN